MSIYFLESEDGKIEQVNTESLIEIYADGHWRGGRPIYFWMTQAKTRFFKEHQSHWLGEDNGIVELSRAEMVRLLCMVRHADRAADGLKLMGALEEIPEIV